MRISPEFQGNLYFTSNFRLVTSFIFHVFAHVKTQFWWKHKIYFFWWWKDDDIAQFLSPHSQISCKNLLVVYCDVGKKKLTIRSSSVFSHYSLHDKYFFNKTIFSCFSKKKWVRLWSFGWKTQNWVLYVVISIKVSEIMKFPLKKIGIIWSTCPEKFDFDDVPNFAYFLWFLCAYDDFSIR